jgi:hypothetical protein
MPIAERSRVNLARRPWTGLDPHESFDLEITSAYRKKPTATTADNGAVDEDVKTCLVSATTPRRPWPEMPCRHGSGRAMDESGHRLLMENKPPRMALSAL